MMPPQNFGYLKFQRHGGVSFMGGYGLQLVCDQEDSWLPGTEWSEEHFPPQAFHQTRHLPRTAGIFISVEAFCVFKGCFGCAWCFAIFFCSDWWEACLRMLPCPTNSHQDYYHPRKVAWQWKFHRLKMYNYYWKRGFSNVKLRFPGCSF